MDDLTTDVVVLNTPSGVFKGKAIEGCVQYSGIKYANLKDQLAVPEMVTAYGDITDATRFGSQCVAMDGCQFEQGVIIQQSIDTPSSPPMSGLDCLNLNITVPGVSNRKPLPVMAFIHGGGYIMGANWWPQYDPARLVKLSMESESPTIVVAFNYRLGILGNLTSKELRDAGYPGNNALRDQRCALRWIKTHISNFGGDSDNVTLFGESAGAASVLNHLSSSERLFKRAISMSGTPTMFKLFPSAVAETSYDIIMKELGLENASTADRVSRLLTISPEELVAKTPMTVPLRSFVDDDIVPSSTTFKDLEPGVSGIGGHQWCAELMIGDCQHDGTIYAYMGIAERKVGIAAQFCTSLAANISKFSTEAVLKAYNLTPSTDDDIAMRTILEYATDIAYAGPALAFARSWHGKAYYYHFNEPNPWDGLFKGCSTHVLDAAFLFQNYNEKLSPEAREVAVSLAKAFLNFANGTEPWQAFHRDQGNAQTFGPSGTSTSAMVGNNGWGEGRRDHLFKLKEEGKVDLDELSVAWDKFLAGQ
ncbi:para-nitrobenzyl esterase [Lophiostoma macrostomum CBS 122681]|uniref:Carboxylic ester hydrolase n=1 Tax=Lophiostoma macrostomum CBS 122681 TaxID=1314788 RepID=A0A6A6TKZ5_9PLEO|nr:para-nitrobenzyl esterase [Lophiostoma macrostomum CBS 122681]